MADQAQPLREIKDTVEEKLPAPAGGGNKIIAVTSGKGGVGKSNIAINLGIALTRFGHRVLVVDADMGLANIDLLLGIAPKHNLSHVISGAKTLEEIIITGPSGVRVAPASSHGRMADGVDFDKRNAVIKAIRNSAEKADTALIDTGGGLADGIVEFLLLADEILLVTTPEPTSMMDSYGALRILAREREETTVKLLVNMAQDQADAQHVSETMKLITRQFFNLKIEDLGWVGYDPNVTKAVRRQQPFTLLYPSTRASRDINRIAMKMAGYEVDFVTERGLAGQLKRLASRFRKG